MAIQSSNINNNNENIFSNQKTVYQYWINQLKNQIDEITDNEKYISKFLSELIARINQHECFNPLEIINSEFTKVDSQKHLAISKVWETIQTHIQSDLEKAEDIFKVFITPQEFVEIPKSLLLREMEFYKPSNIYGFNNLLLYQELAEDIPEMNSIKLTESIKSYVLCLLKGTIVDIVNDDNVKNIQFCATKNGVAWLKTECDKYIENQSKIESLKVVKEITPEWIIEVNSAIKEGNYEFIEALSSKQLQSFSYSSKFIELAISMRKFEVALLLGIKGAKITDSILCSVLYKNQEDLFFSLFKFANENEVVTSSLITASIRNERIFNFLIEKEISCKEHWAILEAIDVGNHLIIQKLAERNFPLDEYAFYRAHNEETFFYLLQINCPMGNEIIAWAAQKGFVNVIEYLVKVKKVPFCGKEVTSACLCEKWFVVDLLMELNAPCDNSTLNWAGFYGHLEIVKKLVKYGAPLTNCLQKPFQKNDKILIDYYLKELKYFPSCLDMEYVFASGNPDIADRLLDLNIELTEDCLNSFDKLPLKFHEKYLSKIKSFSNKSLRYFCLDLSKFEDDLCLKYCRYAIEKGAKPNESTLGYTVESGKIKTLDYLYELGTPLKSSVLYEAILNNQPMMAKHLITKYRMPIELCCFKANTSPELKELLLKALFQEVKDQLYAYEKNLVTDESVKHILNLFELGEHFYNSNKNDNHLIPIIRKSLFDHLYYSISLEKAFLTQIPNGDLNWSFYHKDFHWDSIIPNHDLRKTLKDLSPYGFNKTVFDKLLPITQKACKEEDNQGAELNAYKLTVFFGNVEKAVNYLKFFKVRNPNNKQPVHDACLFEIPKKGCWNIDFWRTSMEKYNFSPKKMKILVYAADIEALVQGSLPYPLNTIEKGDLPKYYKKILIDQIKLDPKYGPQIKRILDDIKKKRTKALDKDLEQVLWNACKERLPVAWDYFVKGKDLKKTEENRHFQAFLHAIVNSRDLSAHSFNDMVTIIVKHLYKDVPEKYYEFALDCAREGIEKNDFEFAVNILEKYPKTTELIPNIYIDGKDVGDDRYEFRKLAFDDPVGFILGKKTGCCQSINGHASDCVIHGMKSSFGGFYVITKKDHPDIFVAQSWAAITENNSLVFDSIEHNLGYNEDLIMRFYKKAAEEILKAQPDISKVLFGGGGNTPKKHQFDKTEFISKIVGYKDIGYDSANVRFILGEQDLAKPINEIKTFDFVLMRGIDTYANPGLKKELTLNPLKRRRFLQQHLNAYALMMNNIKNPLVEEGFYLNNKRDRIGELFLTFDAIKILAEDRFKGSFNHLLLVNNNTGDLTAKLKCINLHEGESLAIIYVEGVHVVTAYLERSDGNVHCFLFDSEEPFEVPITETLGQKFGSIKFIRMTAELQRDFSNCTTFAYKSLLFYAKYGRKLFKEIDKPDNLNENGEFFDLLPEKTPPTLLKMSQTFHKGELELAPAVLNTIVSKKKNLTLNQYLEQNKVIRNRKVFNAAAQLVKYRLITKLNTLLCKK